MTWQDVKIPRRTLVLLGALALVACGGNDGAMGPEGPAGPSPDVDVVSVGAGTECPDGGVRVTVGEAEPFVVCNGGDGVSGDRGQDGAPGQPGQPGEDGESPDVNVEPIDPADADQPCGDAGGLMVTVTVGDDTTVEYLCNGEDGEDGETPVIELEPIDPDADGPCGLAGGVEVTITTGDDTDTYEVCNGTDGIDGETPDDGLTPEITLADIEADTEGACGLAGGTRVTVTVGEDSETFELCNGADGTDGVSPTITLDDIVADEEGVCGLAGGTLVTVTTGEDSVDFEICNGAEGEDGEDGRDGASNLRVSGLDGTGEDCEDVGGVLIEVLDIDGDVESTFTICNGAMGEQGEPGPAPSVSIAPVEDDRCDFGGREITIGTAEPFVLCNGDDGEDGETPSITVESLAAGEEGCEFGGYVLIVVTGEDEERYPLCIGEAGGEPTPLEIGGCVILVPDEFETVVGEALVSRALVFVEGVTGTQSETRPAGYRGQLGIGPVESDPSADTDGWSFEEADLDDMETGVNDEFLGVIENLEEGVYDFAFRFTVDDGDSWTYCDTDDFNTEYDPTAAGRLTVTVPGDDPVVIAGWTFGEGLQGSWAGTAELNANEGLGVNATQALSLVGATPGNWVAGNEGSAPNSNGWNDGVGTHYWLVQLDATGYENLTLSSWHRGSATGPRDFDVEISLNGTDWTQLTSIEVSSDVSGVMMDPVALPAGFDNAGTVWVRWILTSNTSINGGTVAAGGTSRIDSIRIRGEAM